jgi:hypothetical protein
VSFGHIEGSETSIGSINVQFGATAAEITDAYERAGGNGEMFLVAIDLVHEQRGDGFAIAIAGVHLFSV